MRIDPAVFSGVRLSDSVTPFLEETHTVDRRVPEKNVTTMHPELGAQNISTWWWNRTADFEREMLRHHGYHSEVTVRAPREAMFELHKLLFGKSGLSKCPSC